MSAHTLTITTPVWMNGGTLTTVAITHPADIPNLPITAVFVAVTTHTDTPQNTTPQDGTSHDRTHVALVHVTSRGWGLPGGHVEPGETPVDAACRETLEEISYPIQPANLTCIGYQHATNPTTDSRYPPDALMLFYTAAGTRTPLTATLECDNAAWLPARDVAGLCPTSAWVALLEHAGILPTHQQPH
jgi:8-oxo-dGTP pyrophosphatase MutT (NUDIX family)